MEGASQLSHEQEEVVYLCQEGLGGAPPAYDTLGAGSAPGGSQRVSAAASRRQRATVAQMDQNSGAVSRESRLCLLWPEIWGCLHTVVTLGMKGSLKSREVVFLCSLSEEKFYNKQSSCILSACCIHFSGLFSSLCSSGHQA